MISTKTVGMLVAAFVAGSLFASAELRSYAATLVTSADIENETIQSVDIKDGTIESRDIKDEGVLAADIGKNAVGSSEIADNAVGSTEIAQNSVTANELAGVGKLIFKQCAFSSSLEYSSRSGPGISCGMGATVDTDDTAIVTKNEGSSCFEISRVEPGEPNSSSVRVFLTNDCSSVQSPGAGTLAIMVFDN